MPAPYSYDLRSRVIEHYKLHNNITLTGKTFNIGRTTIYSWLELKEKTGDIKAKTGYQNGYGHKIKDMDKFGKFVEKNKGALLSDMVRKSGIKMSTMTCSRALKKLGITRKKRHLAIKREMRKHDNNF